MLTQRFIVSMAVIFSYYSIGMAQNSTITDSVQKILSSEKFSSNGHIVLTAEQIKEMNVQNVPELLNRLPGISAGETYVKIQGVTNVRVLLDGRPINDASSVASGVKWNMVSVHDLEKIEILIGGGAATVGDGTSGGAILLTSIKNDIAHGQVELSAGNFSTEDGSFRFNQNVKSLSMAASGSYYYTDGFRSNSDKTKKRVGARLGFDNKVATTGLSFDYANDKRGYPGKPQWPTPFSRSFSENINGAFTAKTASGNGNLFFSTDKKESNDSKEQASTKFDGRSAGIKIANNFFSSKKPLSFNVGLDAQFEQADGFRKTISKSSSLQTWNYSEEERNAGIWISKNLILPLKPVPLSLSSGLRFNYYSAFPENFNPELRLRFSPFKVNLNAGIALMHNTPPLSKRFYESSTTIRNPDLLPEKGVNTSLGIDYSFSKSISFTKLGSSFSTRAFYNTVEDRITYISSASSAMGQYRNIGHVARLGADFSLGLKFDSLFRYCDVSIDASFGLLDARDLDSDLYLTASPKETSKISMGLKFLKIVSLRFTGEYTGEQFTTTDNLTTSDACFLMNAAVDVKIVRMVIFIKTENILDINYTYSDGYPGDPRECEAGIRCEF